MITVHLSCKSTMRFDFVEKLYGFREIFQFINDVISSKTFNGNYNLALTFDSLDGIAKMNSSLKCESFFVSNSMLCTQVLNYNCEFPMKANQKLSEL